MEDRTSTYEMVRKLRKKLHENPEISGAERKTMEILKDFLRSRTSLELVECDGWFYAVHKEEGAGESIGFRADMDAITGEDKKPYHGCGHDGHSSILAGLGLLLEGKKIGKNVYLIFQPAEETGQGGEICSNLLTEKSIKKVYAFHNLPGYPLKAVVLRGGTFACASRGLILTFKGKQCHAAYPEHGVNPAWLIGELICQIPQIKSRPDFEGMVQITIIEVRVGEEAFGVSPGDGKLALTLRGERLSDLEHLQQSLISFAQKESAKLGMEFHYSIQDAFPDTVNEQEEVNDCRKKLEERHLTCLEEEKPLRWSEDFGWYLKKAGGMFFGIGAGEDCPALHTADYEFPDEVAEAALEAFEAFL